MRRHLQIISTAILVILAIVRTSAQEQFQLTNYIYSLHAINPAFAGIEDNIVGNIGFRRQWASIDDAPFTSYVGINASLNALKNVNLQQRALRKSRPNVYAINRNPGSISHGVGLYVSRDQFGPFREMSVYGAYNLIYHASEAYSVALGASLDYTNQRFISDNVSVYNPDIDQVYQQYAGSSGNMSRLNINMGILVYGKHFYGGYSVHQLGSIKLTEDRFTETGYDGLHHFLALGTNLALGPEWAVQPSALLRYNTQYDLQTDVLAKVRYRRMAWLGVSWRRNDCVGIAAGFQIKKYLLFSYAYEYNNGPIQGYSQGSHEVVLAFRLFSDDFSTPFLW